MNKRIHLANQALRLLPSKTNPRVKRWQAPDEPEGKASIPSGDHPDKDWFASYDDYLDLMSNLYPHLDPHLRRLGEIQRSAPHRGFHHKDYLANPAPRSGTTASIKNPLIEGLAFSRETLEDMGIESPDAFVAEFLGTAFPAIIGQPPRPQPSEGEHGLLTLSGENGHYKLGINIPHKMRMLRSYRPANQWEPSTARHEAFTILLPLENMGLGTAIYAANEAFARKLGSNMIRISPGYIGKYAWPYFGFDIHRVDYDFSQEKRLREIRSFHEMLLYDIMGNIKLNRRHHGKPIPMIEDIEEAIATSPDPYKAPVTGLEEDFLPRLAHMRLPEDFAKSFLLNPQVGRDFLLSHSSVMPTLQKDLTRDNPYYDKAVASRLKRAMGGT